MITNVSTLFHLIKTNNYKSGEKPIYLRITVDGIRVEISTGKYCEPVFWNKKSQRMKGRTEYINILNTYLDTLERKVFEAQLLLTRSNTKITAFSIKEQLLGKGLNPKKLIETFKKHNREIINR
jgi:hypothetical protein